MKSYLLLSLIPLLFLVPTSVFAQESLDEVEKRLEQKLNEQGQTYSKNKPGFIYLEIMSNTYWSGAIRDGNSATRSIDGQGSAVYEIPCGTAGFSTAAFQKQEEFGSLKLIYTQNSRLISQAETTAKFGLVSIVGECAVQKNAGGGCLIATATFDSELAPQVQKLREIRDSKLLQTESGSQFMGSFNQFYYSFSPYIADYERENLVFKEMVKIGITPMIATLSLMDYADTESEVLGIGISLIIVNAMMYVGLPIFGIMIAKKRF